MDRFLSLYIRVSIFRSITRKDLSDYVSLFYKPARMVLAGAGGVDHDELVKLAEQHFGVPPADTNHPLLETLNVKPCRFTGTPICRNYVTYFISRLNYIFFKFHFILQVPN